MKNSNSEKLSKGDVISFITLILLGVFVFLGMNFKTLGDKITSAFVAILLLILMFTSVFLAAYAKAQNPNESGWKKLEYAMVVLYLLTMVPSYLVVAKFFDVQFEKKEIIKEVEQELSDINELFASYKRQCESRTTNYQTELEAMLKSVEGRRQIVQTLGLEKQPKDLSSEDVEGAVDSFRRFLTGGQEYHNLQKEKEALGESCKQGFQNWDILFIPQYALELGNAKERFAEQLQQIFMEPKSPLESNVPQFETGNSKEACSVEKRFSGSVGFSFLGFLALIVLGGLGMCKYILGKKSDIVKVKGGDASVITNGGGMRI